MRFAGVAIVRNESDIIEAFVRHNASVLDRLYIVDNGSSDATAEILRRLAASGLPLTLTHDEGIAYYQGSKTTALIKTAFEDEPWDCLFPLDGDEFLVAPDRAALEAEIAGLPPGEVGLLVPDHYAPLDSDEAGEPDPVRRIAHRTASLPAQPLFHGKVIVPQALAYSPGVAISEGNHHIVTGNRRAPERWLVAARVAHFPVRSAEQFLAKVVTTRLAWLARGDYRASLGSHVAIFYDQLRDRPEITAERLLDAAFIYLDTYLGPHRRDYQRQLIRDPVERGGGALQYLELARISALPRILDFAEQMAKQLGQTDPAVLSGKPGTSA
ncbi:MAG TPA: glycosyltransferase family 2 protein [Dongiaceae bacterium]|nr:glycosyltransferase family 2 protein [Dongiaceae bacterium]